MKTKKEIIEIIRWYENELCKCEEPHFTKSWCEETKSEWSDCSYCGGHKTYQDIETHAISAAIANKHFTEEEMNNVGLGKSLSLELTPLSEVLAGRGDSYKPNKVDKQ